MKTAAFLLTLGTLLLPARTFAEHEVFYRYTVLGYVKDARGRPVPGREVTVVRDKTGFSYLGQSDAGGLYVVTLRLGDESLGERLTVRSGATTASIVVRFDAGNKTEERGTRLDLEGTRSVERAASFAPTLTRFLNAPVPR